jgi:hypothetical protein
MVKCCVFFAVRPEFLNIIQTSFGFKGQKVYLWTFWLLHDSPSPTLFLPRVSNNTIYVLRRLVQSPVTALRLLLGYSCTVSFPFANVEMLGYGIALCCTNLFSGLIDVFGGGVSSWRKPISSVTRQLFSSLLARCAQEIHAVMKCVVALWRTLWFCWLP